MLKLDTYKLTDEEDITFIKEKEKDIREMLINRQNEIEHTVTRSNITNDDRLRFLEAILHDDVKELYLKTQNCMNRVQLDSRQSIMKLVDFYDMVVHIFNDEKFKPWTKVFPNLHSDFATSRELHLGEYVLTRDN